jgi:1-acyl-sn-glycerol-3-phosphate acyltransferase
MFILNFILKTSDNCVFGSMEAWLSLREKPFPSPIIFYITFLFVLLYIVISVMYANAVILLLLPLIFVSPRTFRYLCDNFAAIGWPMFVLCNELIGKNKIIFYGEKVPPRENILLISNHISNADWLQIFGFAYRKSRVGCLKVGS